MGQLVEERVKVDRVLLPPFGDGTDILVEPGNHGHVAGTGLSGHPSIGDTPGAFVKRKRPQVGSQVLVFTGTRMVEFLERLVGPKPITHNEEKPFSWWGPRQLVVVHPVHQRQDKVDIEDRPEVEEVERHPHDEEEVPKRQHRLFWGRRLEKFASRNC